MHRISQKDSPQSREERKGNIKESADFKTLRPFRLYHA